MDRHRFVNGFSICEDIGAILKVCTCLLTYRDVLSDGDSRGDKQVCNVGFLDKNVCLCFSSWNAVLTRGKHPTQLAWIATGFTFQGFKCIYIYIYADTTS